MEKIAVVFNKTIAAVTGRKPSKAVLGTDHKQHLGLEKGILSYASVVYAMARNAEIVARCRMASYILSLTTCQLLGIPMWCYCIL